MSIEKKKWEKKSETCVVNFVNVTNVMVHFQIPTRHIQNLHNLIVVNSREVILSFPNDI
jgi:hypothetical protein